MIDMEKDLIRKLKRKRNKSLYGGDDFWAIMT